MAAPRKKSKLEKSDFSSIIQDFKRNKRQFENLKEAFHALNRFDRSVCLLKITNCVADCKLNFSRVVCRTTRHFSHNLGDSQPPDLYLFIDLFKPGVDLLNQFFENEDFKPPSKPLELVLEKLLTFFSNIDEAEKAFQESLSLRESWERDLAWTIRLSHHYLSKLAVNDSYIIDNRYPVKQNRCDCCHKNIEGQYGDTSIGNTEIWHGYLDILVGHQPITLTPDEPEVRNGSSPVEEGKVIDYEEQMIAQTIVFSFLQKHKHPEYKTFLAPCIGISKKHVVFYFYDSEHDFLLESSCFDLQVPGRGIKKSTVLAMWLTLNYKYLCSGITVAIKESGYTADFHTFGKDKMELYKNRLTFGCGQSSSSKEYYDAGDVSLAWNVKRSGPLQ